VEAWKTECHRHFKDKQYVVYSVSTPDVMQNKSSAKTYRSSVAGGAAEEISNADTLVFNNHISSDGKWKISDSEVKVMNVYGSDFYPDLTKTTAQIYNSLMYRHWDAWEDGKFSHIFLSAVNDTAKKDLMTGQTYDCPQKPFGVMKITSGTRWKACSICNQAKTGNGLCNKYQHGFI
jgi:hypothetical protein